MGGAARRLGPVFTTPHGKIVRGILFKKGNEVVMDRYPFGATHAASLMMVLTACTVLAVAGPLPALAAERTVLCEEFTNVW